ncbi:uncharacterized protein RJT20DRAFT_127738 [Scheffersomyces xylosifermentans]|uniref:uncharacterized protein n=1 Tax=Scheffersomyces xylosifermentans TaxID=1304137 RepID=UPI00315D7100
MSKWYKYSFGFEESLSLSLSHSLTLTLFINGVLLADFSSLTLHCYQFTVYTILCVCGVLPWGRFFSESLVGGCKLVETNGEKR